MTEDEVRALALRMFRNEVWLMWATDPSVRLSFPVLLMALPDMRKDYIESIGAVWEEISKAGPRSINGLPIFFGAHLVHRDDCIPLWWEYEKLLDLVPSAGVTQRG